MIYTCMPYYNEKLLASVRLKNDLGYIDRLVIAESSYTFKYTKKEFNFPNEVKNNLIVDYYQLNGKKLFFANNYWGKLLLYPYRFRKDSYLKGLSSPAWHNEATQRNFVANRIKPKDEDFVILCDIDEILDTRKLDKLLNEAKKRGIVTCKLRFTMFYFDLFVKGWGGPSDYSYRLFVMTGKYFNEMKISSDQLRKRGERKQLIDSVYCLDEYCGFHHSWLGDKNAIVSKMKAYAHSLNEHTGSDLDFIEQCVKNGKAFFDGVTLYYDDKIELLPSVEALRNNMPELFWKGNKK